MPNQSGISYRLCSYCNRMYDVSKKHNCLPKREYIRKRHRQYAKRKKKVDLPLHTKRWYYLRRRIIAADGGYCQRCWLKYGIRNYQHLEVHHIKPRIKYPNLIFDPDNLVTVCHVCNDQLGLQGIDFKWSPKDRHNQNIHYGYVL